MRYSIALMSIRLFVSIHIFWAGLALGVNIPDHGYSSIICWPGYHVVYSFKAAGYDMECKP